MERQKIHLSFGKPVALIFSGVESRSAKNICKKTIVSDEKDYNH